MKLIENFIISFKLKRLIGNLIKKNVSPFKPKETIYLHSNGLRLKIVSERTTGFQRINVYLENHYKMRLSRSDCRRSNKKLNTDLNKKIKNEFTSILKSLESDSNNSFFENFKRNLFPASK